MATPIVQIGGDLGWAKDERSFQPEDNLKDLGYSPIDLKAHWKSSYSGGVGLILDELSIPVQFTGSLTRNVETLEAYGINNDTLSREDKSLATKTTAGVLDVGAYFGGNSDAAGGLFKGVYTGLQFYAGVEKTCNSTGLIGSCYDDTGSIPHTEGFDFSFGDEVAESNVEIPRLVMGVGPKLAWDPVASFADADRADLAGGVQLYATGLFQFYNKPLKGVEANGGTHKVEDDSGRRASATLQNDKMPIYIGVGATVYGNPLAIFGGN